MVNILLSPINNSLFVTLYQSTTNSRFWEYIAVHNGQNGGIHCSPEIVFLSKFTVFIHKMRIHINTQAQINTGVQYSKVNKRAKWAYINTRPKIINKK